MDEPVEDNLTSTVVDHVFFVLQQCTRRSLLSSNMNALCAIINIVVSSLNRDYLEILQKSIQEQIGRLNTLLNRSAVESRISIHVTISGYVTF